MSHITHFYDAPIKADRGRRSIPSTSLYQSQYDYLHDQRPLADQRVQPVGVSAGSLKFGRGFWRRRVEADGKGEDRQLRERRLAEREAKSREEREAVMIARTALCEEEQDMCQHKRHFLTAASASPVLPSLPAVSSSPSSSFSSVPSTPQPLPFTTNSRILATGNRVTDTLPSYGVPDAFMGPSYAAYEYQPMQPGRRQRGGGGAAATGAAAASQTDSHSSRIAALCERRSEYERNHRPASQLDHIFGKRVAEIANEHKEQQLTTLCQ